MTTDEKIAFWYKFNRFIKTQEALYAPMLNKALKAQIQQYIDSGTLLAVTAEPIYPVLVQLYKGIGVKWAHQSHLARQRKSRQPMGFSDKIVALMKQYYGIDLLNDAEGLTQTTKDIIGRVLKEAEDEGLGYDDIVKRLESPDLTATRARLIARTETNTAANGAAVIQAKEAGLKFNKEWLSAKDKRVRMDHREEDGKVVGMDDDFIVGGEAMSQPGDKRGSAKNVCNCRCCVLTVEVL